jgi:hypothetical protein
LRLGAFWTFAELSRKIRPNDDGTPLSDSQVRAVYRKVKRQENSLIKSGALSSSVVAVNFDNYEVEQ